MMRGVFAIASVFGGAVVALQHAGSPGAVDLAEIDDQQLSVRRLDDDPACMLGWNAINPSFSRTDRALELAVAFKGLCLKQHGDGVAWHGSIVIGRVRFEAVRNTTRRRMAWESLQVAPDPRFHGHNSSHTEQECVDESFDLLTGADDVRLLRTNGGLYVVVNGYRVLEHDGEGRPACGSRAILSYAAKVSSLDPPAFEPSVPITYPGMGLISKTWPMFVERELEGAQVRAIHSLYPHGIAVVDLESGRVKYEGHAYSAAVEALARQWKTRPGEFHTGSAVAHVNTDSEEYYLSFMHAGVRRNNQTVFITFPYKFFRHAPHSISHIGKRLDMQGVDSRATSCFYDHGFIFIAYSTGDRSSRTIRMSLEDFDARYFDESVSLSEDTLRRAKDIRAFAARADIDLAPPAETAACTSVRHVESCSDPFSHSVCRACRDEPASE